MEEILSYISAGGNALLVPVAYVLWKLDRRLYKIELLFSNHLKHLRRKKE